MTTIFQAATDQEANDARGLMRAFSEWRHDPQSDSSAPHDYASRDQELEEELAEMLGRYAPPHGRLLVAYEADVLAGCAALRGRGDGDGACEVERIFVKDVFRGQRIGRALLERLLLEAKAAGYLCICFDARANEEDAQRLCERAGFHRISPPLEGHDEAPHINLSFARDLRQTA